MKYDICETSLNIWNMHGSMTNQILDILHFTLQRKAHVTNHAGKVLQRMEAVVELEKILRKLLLPDNNLIQQVRKRRSSFEQITNIKQAFNIYRDQFRISAC